MQKEKYGKRNADLQPKFQKRKSEFQARGTDINIEEDVKSLTIEKHTGREEMTKNCCILLV